MQNPFTAIILTVQLLDYVFIQGTLLQQFGGSPEGLSSKGKQQIKMLPQQQYTAVNLQNSGISVNVNANIGQQGSGQNGDKVVDSAGYLRAGMDVAMGKQVFVKCR